MELRFIQGQKDFKGTWKRTSGTALALVLKSQRAPNLKTYSLAVFRLMQLRRWQ